MEHLQGDGFTDGDVTPAGTEQQFYDQLVQAADAADTEQDTPDDYGPVPIPTDELPAEDQLWRMLGAI